MSNEIKIVDVPDIDGPTEQLCWKQSPQMGRCDRRKGHAGMHTWELAAAIVRAETPRTMPQSSAQPCGCNVGAGWICQRHQS